MRPLLPRDGDEPTTWRTYGDERAEWQRTLAAIRALPTAASDRMGAWGP